MTDRKIAEISGVGTSTFHRWRGAKGRELPELDRVRAFCTAVGADFGEALIALGLQPGRDNPEPEPPLPTEVRTILRALADPNKPDSEKVVIREMLLMLADRARSWRPPRRRGDQDEGEAS